MSRWRLSKTKVLEVEGSMELATEYAMVYGYDTLVLITRTPEEIAKPMTLKEAQRILELEREGA